LLFGKSGLTVTLRQPITELRKMIYPLGSFFLVKNNYWALVLQTSHLII